MRTGDAKVCAAKSKAPGKETPYRVLLVGPSKTTSDSKASPSATAAAVHMRACRHVDGAECVTVLDGGI